MVVTIAACWLAFASGSLMPPQLYFSKLITTTGTVTRVLANVGNDENSEDSGCFHAFSFTTLDGVSHEGGAYSSEMDPPVGSRVLVAYPAGYPQFADFAGTYRAGIPLNNFSLWLFPLTGLIILVPSWLYIRRQPAVPCKQSFPGRHYLLPYADRPGYSITTDSSAVPAVPSGPICVTPWQRWSLRRYYTAYTLIILAIMGIGLLCGQGIVQQTSDQDITSMPWLEVCEEIVGPALLLVVLVGAGIFYIARGASKMHALLRRALQVLDTATPTRMSLSFTYTAVPGSEKVAYVKSFHVRLATLLSTTPGEFEILPPLGALKVALGKIDWSHRGPLHAFSAVIPAEEADVYADPDGLVVAVTRNSIFIREMDPADWKRQAR